MARSARAASSPPPAGSITTTFTPPTPSLPIDDDDELEAPGRPLSFWEQVAQVPEHLWWDGSERSSGYRIYCHDEEGPSTYFAIVHEPIDLEWVRKNYGGGIYKFNLNNVENKFQASTKFRIEGASVRKKPAQSVGVQAPTAGNDLVLAQILEAMREDQRQMREMLRDAMRGGNLAPAVQPAQVDPTEMFKGMLTMFQTMFPKQTDPLETLIKLQSLAPKQSDPLDTIMKLKQAGLFPDGASGGNLLEQLTMWMTVAEKLGFSASGGRSWTEILIEKAPDLIKEVRTVMSDYNAVERTKNSTAEKVLQIQKNQREMQRGAQPQTQPQPGQPQSTPPPASAPQPETPGQATLDVDPVGSPGQAMAEYSASAIDQIKAHLVNLVGMGVGGYGIVDWLYKNAPLLVEGFRGVPEDQLLKNIATDPILSQAQQSPNFLRCVHEIVQALDDEEEQESASN